MGILNIQHTLDRIMVANEDSQIAVFMGPKHYPDRLESKFDSTTETARQKIYDDSYIGSFHSRMHLNEVRKHLEKCIDYKLTQYNQKDSK